MYETLPKISKRKDRNTWQYTVKDPTVKGGYRKVGGFKTKALAEADAKKYLQENSKIKKEWIAVDYLKHWVKINNVEHKITKKGFAHYKRGIEFFEEYFGQTKLKDITRTNYQQMLNEYGKTRTRETVRKIHTPLRSMFKDALYDDLILKDPTYKIVLHGHVEGQKEEDKYIELEDYELLLNHIKDSTNINDLVIYITAITGARINEVMNLTFDDLGSDTLKIRGTKTLNSNREIQVTEQFIQHIKDVLHFKTDGLLFNMSTTTIYKRMDKIQKQLEIDDKIRPHKLRHTHTSYLLAKGHPIEYISKRLGHADINITLGIYTHVLKKHKNDEDDKIKTLLQNM